MNDKNQKTPRSKAETPAEDARRSAISSSLDRFEKRQNELWRLTFLVLFLVGVALVVATWDSIRAFWHQCCLNRSGAASFAKRLAT